jgi:hypothetical protein
MDNTIFKQAEIKEEPIKESVAPVKDAPTEDVHASELPPSLYKEQGKEPLINEILNTSFVYKQFNMQELTDQIDLFINSEIKRTGVDDDRVNYEKILNTYSKKFESCDPYSKIENIHKLIEIDKKLIAAIQEKEELLNSDPRSLTASQLKKYLELKGVKYA